MQKTYVMVKPHFANYEIVINEVKKRLLELDLKIVEESFIKYNRAEAQKHYAEHLGKPFYPTLEDYITSEKAYGMIVEGENSLTKVRQIAGSTIKKNKETGEVLLPAVGTIRRDIPAMIGEDCRLTENVIHSSDSEESARKEIGIFSRLKKINQMNM